MVSAGRDLRAIFALLRKDGSGRVSKHSALLLLRALTAMARHLGPTTFFDFANEGAGIMRNNPLRFPGALLLAGRQAAPALHAHIEDHARCSLNGCLVRFSGKTLSKV